MIRGITPQEKTYFEALTRKKLYLSKLSQNLDLPQKIKLDFFPPTFDEFYTDIPIENYLRIISDDLLDAQIKFFAQTNFLANSKLFEKAVSHSVTIGKQFFTEALPDIQITNSLLNIYSYIDLYFFGGSLLGPAILARRICEKYFEYELMTCPHSNKSDIACKTDAAFLEGILFSINPRIKFKRFNFDHYCLDKLELKES